MLPRPFYDRPALEVARDLIGLCLVHRTAEGTVAGRIVEAEAYIGAHDLACHAARGRTRRTEVMFGPPGHAYVYLIYGMHWCLNLVTCPEDTPAAVLVRAVEPTDGLDLIRSRRPKARRDPDLTSGPGRVCAAFAIDGSLNGADLCRPDGPLYVEDRGTPRGAIIATARIGVDYAGPWAAEPFRLYEHESPFVSARPKAP